MPSDSPLDLPVFEKIRALPPERRAEVEDFVDLLLQRERDRDLLQATMKLSEEVLSKVWDNPEDAVYDEL
jgi:hypothetical protein